MSRNTIQVATASAVAAARPRSIRIEVAYGHLVTTTFRNPAPTFVGDLGPVFATGMAADLQYPSSVSGKQLWSHPV